MDDPASRLMALYPRIFFACHRRHVRDPKTRVTISAHQGSILDHLDTVHAISLNTLADHMGVTPGTMSIHVDRLEELGYVRRQRDAEDGRKVRLRLTKAGERVKCAQSVLDPEDVAAMLAGLSPREREQALEGLALLAKAAEKLMRSKAQGRREVVGSR